MIIQRPLVKLFQVLLAIGTLYFLHTALQAQRSTPQSQQAASVPSGSYRVVDTADGDTLYVSMDGVKEKVRLVAVDTPETHHPTKPVQCYGIEASNYTASLVKQKAVRLRSDTKQPNRDKYGRLLRYVYLEDGRELNELLVSGGYAFVTNFNTERKDELKTLQRVAKTRRTGLWGACTIVTSGAYTQTNAIEAH